MTLLSSEQILNIKPHSEEVTTEFGTILVTGMTAVDRLAFEKSVVGKELEEGEFLAHVIIATVKDSDHKNIFESAEQVMAMPFNVVEKLSSVGLKLSGMGTESQKEIEKN